MHLPALPKSFSSFFVHSFLFLVLSSLFLVIVTAPASAQTYDDISTNPDVPQNSHTKSQILLIENSAAIICQIVGIDIIDPQKGCLGIDTETGKIGYATEPQRPQQLGGMLGMSANMLGAVYHPPASGTEYVAGVMDNFGIVKKTYAQEENPSGFEALYPVQKIWEVTRNITYALLVLVFIGIGVGIMLRVKIDPRTAMSIQNQVPRIIVAILLITFSYSIIGFMVDLMWLSTYVGVNALSSVTNETVCATESGPELTVGETAYANLLNSPLAFMNDILKHGEPYGQVTNSSGTDCDMGIKYLSIHVSQTAGTFITELVQEILGVNDQPDCGWFPNPGCAVREGFSNFIGWLGQIFMYLVVFIAILIVMFRLWWQLLRAYALIIFYTILGPIWILLGLLPNSERNFNSWMRTVTAKLLAFPAAAIMIVIARVMLDTYNPPPGSEQADLYNPSNFFTPPLVGNPILGDLGPLVAFAILLITPEVLNMLNDAFKAPSNQRIGPAITGGVAAGLAVGAPAALLSRRAFLTDSAGNARGAGAVLLSRWATHGIREGTGVGGHGTPASGLQKNVNRAKGLIGRTAVLATGGRADAKPH